MIRSLPWFIGIGKVSYLREILGSGSISLRLIHVSKLTVPSCLRKMLNLSAKIVWLGSTWVRILEINIWKLCLLFLFFYVVFGTKTEKYVHFDLVGRKDRWKWAPAMFIPWMVIWWLWVLHTNPSGFTWRPWSSCSQVSKSLCYQISYIGVPRSALCLARWEWLGKSSSHQASHVIDPFLFLCLI